MLSIEIDADADLSVYQQIADQLRALIARGALDDGAELPSVRRLGAQIGVNLNTVARAYRTLAADGLIELRHGAAARVRVPRPGRGDPKLDDEARRRLFDLFSRWRLEGANRKQIERVLASAAAEFFD